MRGLGGKVIIAPFARAAAAGVAFWLLTLIDWCARKKGL